MASTESENKTSEIDDSSGYKLSNIKHMCLRNGLSNGFHCNQLSRRRIQGKLTFVRVNGCSKITIDQPSLSVEKNQNGLRSSRTSNKSIPTENQRKRRRSPRLERHDDSDSTESEDCVNNNKVKKSTLSFIPTKDLPTPPSDHNDSLSSCSSIYFRNSSEGPPGTTFLSPPLSPPETTGSCTPPSGASTPAVPTEFAPGPPRVPAVSAIVRQDSSKSCDSGSSTVTYLCKWLKCGGCFQREELADHVKHVHVDPQKDASYSPPSSKVKSQGNLNGSIHGSMRTTRSSRSRTSVLDASESDKEEKQKKFVCLWEGCKVYNKPSCSFSWVDRHFLLHCGDKPFKCIVDGCGQRFPTQGSLERHVNSHFNTYQAQPNQRPSKPTENTTPSKSSAKRRKVRKSKRSCIIKTTDFFDANIMERLQYQLMLFSQKTQMGITPTQPNPHDEVGKTSQATTDLTDQSEVAPSASSVTFRSTVIAKRKDTSGKVQVLLRWHPNNILPDSWVLESQAAMSETKVVPLTSLPPDTVTSLDPSFYSHQHRRRKHRRK